MGSARGFHSLFGLTAVTVLFVWATPAAAGGVISAAGGVLQFGTSTGGVHTTLIIGGGSTATSSSPASTTSSSVPGNSLSSINDTAPNLPTNLFGSSQSSGSEGGGSSGGGGLVWGDPLSADIGGFGNVRTRLHYFSQSSYNGTQQAVGVNFSVRF
jgi:hypothetical protein